MNYGTYGFDPAMAADADRIFQLVVDTLFNQGQLDANQRSVLMNQYGTYRSSIINDVVTKASQAGRVPDQQMIQESIHGFVTNVIQSLNTQRQNIGGYMGYTPNNSYIGYGQQPGCYTTGYQPNNAYSNPMISAGQIGYGQPSGYQSNYQPNGYNGYVSRPVSNSAAVTASRYTNTAQAERQQPSSAAGNVFERNATAPGKVEYNAPMVLNEETVNTEKINGSKKTVRIGSDQMADVLIGKFTKPVRNFRDFVKRASSLITNKNQFVMVQVQVPKLLKAPAREVNALIQKFSDFINRDMASNSNSLEFMPDLFKRFYAEWVKETGDAHKELTRILVDEFNNHTFCGYLFNSGIGRLKINALDDILELLDKNTTIERIKEWQQSPEYMIHLASLIYHSIISPFLGRNDYRVYNPNNEDDRRIISTIFQDLSVSGFSVSDSFAALTKAISSSKIEPETASAIPALNATINEHSIIMVPRIFVYTNLAPAGFVTGDYANPTISREVATVSNMFEDYLVAGFKALNTNGTTPVVQGVLCTGISMYGFNVGTNTQKHLYIGPAKDPVITF